MELKKTLIMNKGTFEMRGNLPLKEPNYVKKFEEMKLYERLLKEHEGQEEFYLHDGPPYANGDMHGNFYGDALVAFNLKDLPDTEGKTVKMKLRIYYGSGVKNTIEFDYCTRKASGNTDLFLDGVANSLRPVN